VNTETSLSIGELRGAVAHSGFAYVSGDSMRIALQPFGALTDWSSFADSWNDLAIDTYLADRGSYRRRRHAVFDIAGSGAQGFGENGEGAIVRVAHQPHYQSAEYNSLYGGIERWFEPVAATIGNGASMRCVLGFCHALFGSMAPRVQAWRVEAHQFRIEARPDAPGQPTPEGVHRDGVDYVLVLLIARHNIASGTTTIHALDGQLRGSFTLTQPLDAALVEDARVRHGVTAVTPLDPALPAHRDVLVVTFKRSRA
jgi:hypothetical protein